MRFSAGVTFVADVSAAVLIQVHTVCQGCALVQELGLAVLCMFLGLTTTIWDLVIYLLRTS